ncbi:MAG: NDP-sugar synthase [Opitutales bacterium]
MPTPLTLVVMAAGMGSRYGGLKQLDGFGPGGETLLEFSLYDAQLAGFDRAVFVIRRDLQGVFREKVLSRFEHAITCCCVFQELDNLPGGHRPPPGREKPWGTGQAVLAARGTVEGPFAVINADDYYGRQSFEQVAEYLRNQDPSQPGYALCGYRLRNTLSEHGSVSRGLCLLDEGGHLLSVTEHPKLESDGRGNALSQQPDGEVPIRGDTLVSMNFWGFTPVFFDSLAEQFRSFLDARGAELKSEFYLPAAVDTDLRAGRAQVAVLPTESTWFGVTYPEDRARVAASVSAKVEAGDYPQALWPTKGA